MTSRLSHCVWTTSAVYFNDNKVFDGDALSSGSCTDSYYTARRRAGLRGGGYDGVQYSRCHRSHLRVMKRQSQNAVNGHLKTRYEGVPIKDVGLAYTLWQQPRLEDRTRRKTSDRVDRQRRSCHAAAEAFDHGHECGC